jgi:hypothetical protein
VLQERIKQKRSSESLLSAKKGKPPAALAGGGLCGAHSKDLIGQASFPASELGLVIRIAGIDVALHKTGRNFEMRPEMCMALIEVEQSRGERVKAPAVRQTLAIRSHRP